MTTNTTHGVAAPEVRDGWELRHVDPRVVADNPDNARHPKRDRVGLAASITSLGVLTPPLVRELEDGSLVLIAGERRKYSAIEAGLKTIPVFVRRDLSDVQRLAGMLIENTDREGLTVVEEAVTLQRLAGFEGMTAKSVSELTGIKAAVVRLAVKVANSDVARDVAQRHSLTLEQAAALAEFEDDEAAVKQLTQYATERPEHFKHALSRLREDRRESLARSVKISELESKGLVVIEAPSWNADTKVTRLDSLQNTDGKALTTRNHAKCPGHAVALGRWDVDVVEGYCLDATTYGHQPRFTRSGGERSVGGTMSVEQKAERQTVVANNKAWVAAESVRREHVVELLARRSVPKGTLVFAVRDVLTNSANLDAPDELLTELTAVKATGRYGHSVGAKLAEATPEARLALALLAQVAASIEHSTSKGTWRSANPRVATWFTYLATTGYTLSEVEQLVVDTAAKEK
ncbi:MAG: ParB/RepB/Spo0J family partition protein [Acidimicrobiales bacterium]